jgi:BlaI family transcriptional regulator, penicillinase repressor
MRRYVPPKPTNSELDILRVLWTRGPSTVREVLESLDPKGETGYTTVLKLLQIMARKMLVQRDVSQRTHVYRAAMSEEDTQKRLVGDLLDRAFGGSATKLVMQALGGRKTTPEEIREIQRLLKNLEGGKS